MNSDAANASRCVGRAGTYEAWYLTVAEPSLRRGYWIRYTTFNPARAAGGDPHSALWLFCFDHDDPSANWGAKAMFPLEALQARAHPFVLRLGDALLVDNGCSGRLQSERGTASWNLRWDSRDDPFPFLSPRWQGLSSVANIAAHPALRVSGTIEINGRAHHLEHAPGGQQHTWGTSHALEWNWGFASGDDFWFDGASSRVRSRFGRSLAGTAAGAHARQERFVFNRPLQVMRARNEIDLDAWKAKVTIGDRTLHVSVDPRRADLVGVTYADPAGGTRYCYHTEVADFELRLTQGEKLLARIHRPASAAFEYGAETPVPGMPLLL
jgi:hypothetical protein